MSLTHSNVLELLRNTRLAKGMSQATLAKAIGISQAAVSRVEGGEITAISVAKLSEMLQFLGMDLDAQAVVREMEHAARPVRFRFCAHVWCPSCVPFRVGKRLYLMPTPRPVQDGPEAHKYCDLCGEPLQERCPGCGLPASGRVMCPACGSPLVPVDDATAAEIVAQRVECQAEGRELHDLWLLLTEWQNQAVGMAPSGMAVLSRGSKP